MNNTGRVAAFITALLFTANPSAQVLEEVVVTAQKREQGLQDVGISVTAFSGDQLTALGFTDTTQIDEQVPGLIVSDYGTGVTTVFTIRGSAQLDFADLQEPPVAVYSDGAYNSYLAGVGFSFFDLDRIEVLRGPQGTLFGRNATGGVVHLISNRPTDEYEGYLELTGGDYGQFRTEGAISGPLGDGLAGRLSMTYHQNNGYVDNLTLSGSDTSEIGNFSGRAQLLFEPNEDLSLLVIGYWGTDDITGGVYDTEAVVPNADGLSESAPSLEAFQAFCVEGLGFPAPPPAGSADCFGTPSDGDPYTVHAGTAGLYKRDHYGFTAELNWQAGNFLITNIINWQDIKKRYVEDTESSPIDAFDFFQDMDSNQFSEEFRVSWETDNAQFVAGAYYLKIDSDMNTGVSPLFFGFDLDNTIFLETDTWAAFLQAEWNFAPQWTVIGGFRWTEDDKDFQFYPTCPNEFGIPGFPPTDCLPLFGPQAAQSNDLEFDRSEGDWSGVLELDWTPNDDLLLYAKVSRGHKAGGYNGGPASTYPVETVEFDGEILWSYEGGFKATLFGGTTRVNTSIFYYDYNDFQSFENLGIDLFLSNIDSENVGAEIEIFTNPWEGWEFLFGIGIQDAKQKDFTFAGITRDRPMPNAPDLMLNGLARYEWGAFMDGKMSAQVDFNYVDKRTINAVDHPILIQDDYVVVNARLGWTSADESWEASVWVKNLNDEEYFPTAFEFAGFTGTVIRVVAPPRWFGGTVRYNWKGL